MRIERLASLEAVAFAPLLAASIQEGWRHLVRLRDDWVEGLCRFDGPGEGLFAAYADDGAWAGVCGLCADPYARKAEIGRLRRMYVAPEWRRRGIGTALARHVLAQAGCGYRELRLRTTDRGAAAFYAALGFEPVAHMEGATHRCVLVR